MKHFGDHNGRMVAWHLLRTKTNQTRHQMHAAGNQLTDDTRRNKRHLPRIMVIVFTLNGWGPPGSRLSEVTATPDQWLSISPPLTSLPGLI